MKIFDALNTIDRENLSEREQRLALDFPLLALLTMDSIIERRSRWLKNKRFR